MSASTVMEALDMYIKEELPLQTIETGPEIDPIYTRQVRTSEGVESAKVGRGWQFMHSFSSGVSGQYEPRATTGGVPYTNATGSVFYSSQIGFPNPAETPHVTTVTRILTLNCHHGNYSLPVWLLKPEALESANFDQALRDFQGMVKLRAQHEAVSFYAPSAGYLGTIAAAGGTDGSTDYSMTFTPRNSRIKWWRKGMMVDVWDTAAATGNKINENAATTDIPLVVDNVNYIDGTVTLTNWNGAFKIAGDEDNCYGGQDLDEQIGYIFPHGASDGTTLYQTGHYGLEDWMISTGTLFGNATAWTQVGNDKTAAFTIANHPEFASSVTTDLNAPLTDLTLNNKVGAFLDAYDGTILDTMITTQKVVNKYIEQASLGANRFVYDVDGKALDIVGGWRSVKYAYEGRMFDVLVSPYCQSGTLYMLKLGGGNLKRYVPPRAKALDGNAPGSGMGFDGEIEFLNGLTNNGQIFSLTNSTTTGQAEPLAEAPFYQYSQVAPVDVRGIKISGITESSS